MDYKIPPYVIWCCYESEQLYIDFHISRFHRTKQYTSRRHIHDYQEYIRYDQYNLVGEEKIEKCDVSKTITIIVQTFLYVSLGVGDYCEYFETHIAMFSYTQIINIEK
jgi:hypothetical protein